MISESKSGQLVIPGSKPSIKSIVLTAYGFAEFSDDMRYRTRLIRQWDISRPAVLFFMLNPSTADARKLDPTVRRCLGFAYQWGFGSFEIRNLFSFRATSPSKLKKEEDPVGPMEILYPGDSFDLVVAAWGNHGKILGRGIAVEKFLMDSGVCVYHLGLTGDGYPKHPLYIPSDKNLELLDFNREVKTVRRRRVKSK